MNKYISLSDALIRGRSEKLAKKTEIFHSKSWGLGDFIYSEKQENPIYYVANGYYYDTIDNQAFKVENGKITGIEK